MKKLLFVLGVGFLQEFLILNDKALMISFSHNSAGIAGCDLEHQLPAFYCHQLTLAGDFHAHRGSAHMLGADHGSHASAAFIQLILYAFLGGFLHKFHQCRCG